MIILSYLLALLIGLSIGIMGSGGAILAVPILYYVAGYSMQEASVYSLFVVGISSLVGAIRNWYKGFVNLQAVLYFGISSVFSVYLTRLLIVPNLPDPIFQFGRVKLPLEMGLLVLFASLMVMAARSMLSKQEDALQGEFNFNSAKTILQVVMMGLLVGTLTAVLGAGGGFLIIPALVLYLRIPMKTAIGTSMVIVAMNALNGFITAVVSAHHQTIDYFFLTVFSIMALTGLFVGLVVAKRINPDRLKKSFAYFILIMGLFIIVQQLIKSFL